MTINIAVKCVNIFILPVWALCWMRRIWNIYVAVVPHTLRINKPAWSPELSTVTKAPQCSSAHPKDASQNCQCISIGVQEKRIKNRINKKNFTFDEFHAFNMSISKFSHDNLRRSRSLTQKRHKVFHILPVMDRRISPVSILILYSEIHNSGQMGVWGNNLILQANQQIHYRTRKHMMVPMNAYSSDLIWKGWLYQIVKITYQGFL